MALNESTVRNFETLELAFENGDACVVECYDTEADKTVPAVCAVRYDADAEEFHIIPFAVMIEENPYKRLLPPNSKGGFDDVSSHF